MEEKRSYTITGRKSHVFTIIICMCIYIYIILSIVIITYIGSSGLVDEENSGSYADVDM